MYQQISFVKTRWLSIDNITLINQQKYFLIDYEIKKHWTVEKGKENNILTTSTVNNNSNLQPKEKERRIENPKGRKKMTMEKKERSASSMYCSVNGDR